MKLGPRCWDAFHPSHAPLPRAVGPYTVLRTTKLISSSAKVMIFNTAQAHGDTGFGTSSPDGSWLTTCAIGSVNESNPIADPMNSYVYGCPFPGNNIIGGGTSVVPAALSVQVMNPGALQSTHGIFAGTVSTAQLDLTGRIGETWTEFSNSVISYMKPRLMSAGKLALRGVQADAYPLNMSALSDFGHVRHVGDGAITWEKATGFHPAGFSPIVFINEEKEPINYLVTIEWRVRFDIGNAAVATHTDHGVSSDASWAAAIKSMVDRGHGMMDIADKVANMGASAARVAGAVSPLLA